MRADTEAALGAHLACTWRALGGWRAAGSSCGGRAGPVQGRRHAGMAAPAAPHRLSTCWLGWGQGHWTHRKHRCHCHAPCAACAAPTGRRAQHRGVGRRRGVCRRRGVGRCRGGGRCHRPSRPGRLCRRHRCCCAAAAGDPPRACCRRHVGPPDRPTTSRQYRARRWGAGHRPPCCRGLLPA